MVFCTEFLEWVVVLRATVYGADGAVHGRAVRRTGAPDGHLQV
jgi:hypothetical protein